MRRFPWILAVVAGAFWASEGRSQEVGLGGFGSDPFALYYGFFLPRQAALAAQPGPEATINSITADRQRYAVTNRASLYDPASPYAGVGGVEDLGTFDSDRGERIARPRSSGLTSNHTMGSGPQTYYNRTARYYPTLRSGRSVNRNIAVRSGGGGRRGGIGTPGISPSMPTGPR